MTVADAITTLRLLREDLHLEAHVLADRVARADRADVKAEGRRDLAELVKQANAIDTVIAAVEKS